jgi:phenylpropionate dioxygenase-like ring-hydroxylating dioxygenase large terminal subunit
VSDLSYALWEGYWHLAGHLSELARPRDFVRLSVGTADIVLFNDGNEIVAFDNLCPHRGTRIFDESHGNKPFVCRYHGWSYSKGKIYAGNKDQFSHCDLDQAKLGTLSLERVGDFLFVAVAPKQSVKSQLGELFDIVTAIAQSISNRHDFDSYQYDCYWPIAVENALEPYHVPLIHANSLDQLDLAEGVTHKHDANSIWLTEVGNKSTSRRLEKLSKMFDMKYKHPGYMNIYLFPFSMISSTFGISYSVQNFLPDFVGDKSNFASRLYTSKTLPKLKPHIFQEFFDSTAAINRQIFKEDSEICARVPKISWSIEDPKFYAKSEERIVFFREACRQAEAQKSNTP